MSDKLELQQEELEALKQFCDNAQIPYHPTIGLDKLKEKVQKFHDAQEEAEIKAAVANRGMSTAEKARKEAMKLVRVRVACMDPNKRDYEGDYLSVSNSVVGTVKRMVPFGVDWHIEQIMLNMMQEKVFRQSYDVPDGKGGKFRKNRFVKTYAIEVLPPLSEQELADLAHQQASRNSIDND